MQFNFINNDSGGCYIENFLSKLDDVTKLKIYEKLKYLQTLNRYTLSRTEHIKKIENGIYEVRIPIKKNQYRMLGTITGNEFKIVHAFNKKTKKLPQKELKITRDRLKLII
jgi:phage-related protein